MFAGQQAGVSIFETKRHPSCTAFLGDEFRRRCVVTGISLSRSTSEPVPTLDTLARRRRRKSSPLCAQRVHLSEVQGKTYNFSILLVTKDYEVLFPLLFPLC
jgi:hypothetical protein